MSRSSTRRFRTWFVPIGILGIAGLLITLALLQSNGNDDAGAAERPITSEEQSAQPQQPDLTQLEARDPNDVQAAGPVDAPVGLIIYSDYQCPFCAKWSTETLPTMLQYAKLGDLRIEWRDVSQFGELSERATRAAHAAGIQGKFWEYHAALFDGGEPRTPEQLTEEALVGLAGQFGLDPAQFTIDMNSESTISQVDQFAAEGRQLGVSGTPAFVLGGEPIVGAQPTEVFVDLLTAKLAEAR